ncbi:diguanylate cyclase [Synergistaceae bacterium OttesenSCG-928-I11]|nr:diguanylate cyclase [Synergistaceae bacterium OttesenSCG-928-I11]
MKSNKNLDESAGASGAKQNLLFFIKTMNEIFFLINEDRTIEAASDMAYEALGLDGRSDEPIRIDRYFPVVYIDAIFSRVREDDVMNMSMTFPVQSASGRKLSMETRFNWFTMDDRDMLAITCRDIGRYTATISDLTAREDLYRTIFHESPLGFIHINSDGIVADCNSVFLDIFGFIREQVIGLCIADEKRLERYARFRDAAMNAIKGTGSTYEAKFSLAEGIEHREGWARVSFSPIISETKSFLGAVGIVEDVSEEKYAEEKVAFISNHDVLTGLFNRRACEEALVDIDRPENLPIGVIYVDLNHLKLANDAFGHHEGDALLQKCASILKANTTSNDEGYRWGGDEFVLLLKNTDRSELRTRVNNINRMCQVWTGEGIVRPSMAIGSAIKIFEKQDMEEVIKEAEDTMYANKLRNGQLVRRRLMTTLEAKLQELMDGAVGERSKRMLLWGDWMLKNLFIPDEADKRNLRLLCRYHDIGLLASSDELEVVRTNPAARRTVTPMQHMAVGYRIARSVAEIYPVADYILSHHEHWDGSGYPNQQKGTEIPYLSRLVSVFDAIEGMLSLNSYANRPSFGEVLNAIEACAGKLYDPDIVVSIVTRLRKETPIFVDYLEG